jgi:hypothetical protein
MTVPMTTTSMSTADKNTKILRRLAISALASDWYSLT